MEHQTDPAAERGNPSFVWRAGQERRLALVHRYAPLNDRRILDVGCGIGMYAQAFRRYSRQVFGIEIEYDRAREATTRATGIAQSVGEHLPFADRAFDLVFSHEVLEHVRDDRACMMEMLRVTRVGGRLVLFVPNRLYPFETHGIYWRGTYHFGNIPLVNWLPNRFRQRLAPHVRAYSMRALRALVSDTPTRPIVHTLVYPGYDNIVARLRALGKLLQSVTYAMERTPLRYFGLSHFLVLERTH